MRLRMVEEGANQSVKYTPLGRAIIGMWGLAKHPVTGIFVAVAVGFITYFLSRSAKDPVFAVSPTEPVAQTVNGEGNLKILWEGKEIQNAASVKIAFWNNGSQYIDRNDISTSEPIRIQSTAKVRILSVNAIAVSRDSLKFDLRKEIDSNGYESEIVTIQGDEALERFDGASLHVLFSGPLDSRWVVTGRVKGVPEGFRKKEWSKVSPPTRSIRVTLLVLLGGVVLSLLSITFYEFYSSWKLKRPLRWWRLAIAIIYMLVLLGSAFSSNLAYIFAPHWLAK